MTNQAYISVNGKQVASEQFQSKTESDLKAQVSRWLIDTGFTVRATLKAAGTETATILLAEDNYKFEFRWIAVGGSYGTMRVGMANFTDTQKAQAWRLIHAACETCGTLTDGQLADLLLNKLDWLPDAHSAHNLLADCRDTPYTTLEQLSF
jgi:hypothetical protein